MANEMKSTVPSCLNKFQGRKRAHKNSSTYLRQRKVCTLCSELLFHFDDYSLLGISVACLETSLQPGATWPTFRHTNRRSMTDIISRSFRYFCGSVATIICHPPRYPTMRIHSLERHSFVGLSDTSAFNLPSHLLVYRLSHATPLCQPRWMCTGDSEKKHVPITRRVQR